MNKILRNEDYMPHQSIVYTNTKFLSDFSMCKVKFAYDIRKEHLGQDDAIWEIEIHPTNLCNLHCVGCSYGTRHNTHALTLEQVGSIINQYSKYDLKSVFFSGGGDPLLWKHWDDFFKNVKKMCSYGIATNMYNFNAIQKYWNLIDFYQIHVTGYNEETSKSATGVDSFQRINENIIFLLKHKLPTQNIALKIIVDSNNYLDLPNYLNYVMNLGADSIILKLQQDFLVNRDFANKEILDSVRYISYSHHILSKYDYLLDNLDDIIYKSLPRPEKCIFANSGLYRLINAEGELFPCIASNACSNSIKNEVNFIDIYSQSMLNGDCPLKACRHYRFSQYLSNQMTKVMCEYDMPVPKLL